MSSVTPAATASTSERLRRKIELVLPELMAAGRAVMTHPRLAELYPEYLFTVHTMVRATVPVLHAALDRASAMAAGDAAAAGVAEYLSHHIREEVNHDVWILEDLEALGRPRAEILRRPPSPTVAALIGSQYYWIHHYHPVVLLGHVEVMEGYPPSEEQVRDLRARTGFPAEAVRSLARHARLDPHHRDDLNAALDRLPLTADQEALMGVNALKSVHLASRALREVVSQTVLG